MGDQKEKYPGEWLTKLRQFYTYAGTHNCGDCPASPYCKEVSEHSKYGGFCDFLKELFRDAEIPKDQARLF